MGDDNSLAEVLKYLVIVQFVLCLYTNYAINRWLYNIYGIFLALLFVFIISRVVLDVVNYSDFGQTSFFSSYIFSKNIQVSMLTTIFISLASLNIGFILNGKHSCNYLGYQQNRSQVLLFYGKLLVAIGLIPTFASTLWVAYIVAKYGYLATFLNPELFSTPLIISIGAMFFPLGFLFCHLGNLQGKKLLLLINVLFFSSVIIEVAVGKRGPVLTQLLVLLWFFAFKTGRWYSLKKMSILAIIMIVGSQASLTIRSGKQTDLADLFGLFFYQQGVSVQLLGYAEQYNISDNYDFSALDLLRPVYQNLDKFWYKISGQVYDYSPPERMKKYNNYSMIISNRVDRNKFENGFGLGGSYLVELKLIFGYAGLVIFNIIIGYLLSRVEYYCQRSFYLFCVLFLTLPTIIYMPRSYIMEFANTQMRPVILFFLCIALIKLTRRTKVPS